MEVCQSLLKMAPRSEAVREILEEAREAYEAQPFIAEHLEIARQLFVQSVWTRPRPKSRRSTS
jgi:hypothetical protein